MEIWRTSDTIVISIILKLLEFFSSTNESIGRIVPAEIRYSEKFPEV